MARDRNEALKHQRPNRGQPQTVEIVTDPARQGRTRADILTELLDRANGKPGPAHLVTTPNGPMYKQDSIAELARGYGPAALAAQIAILESSTDPETLIDVSEKILNRGSGKPAGSGVTVNTQVNTSVVVAPVDLDAVRARIAVLDEFLAKSKAARELGGSI